jgi:hypothetical protein
MQRTNVSNVLVWLSIRSSRMAAVQQRSHAALQGGAGPSAGGAPRRPLQSAAGAEALASGGSLRPTTAR